MGLFKRNEWWRIDYYDAEGTRCQTRAAPRACRAALAKKQRARRARKGGRR
jgi:hypothetical protein